MTFVEGWTCRACWKSNRPQDQRCYRCKAPRDADQAAIEEHREVAATKAAKPEAVPDIVVALPVVIFRGYSRVWLRGGMVVLVLLALVVFGGVTDVGYILLTGGLGTGLIVFGIVAGEVAEAMRNREVWSFAVGIGMSVVGVVASVMAFEVLAPGVFNPTAIRWASVVVFGGAALAAMAGLVLMFARRDW